MTPRSSSPRPPQRLDPLRCLLKKIRENESRSVEATLCKRRIVAGFVARIEDTKLSECVIFRELGECGFLGRSGEWLDWLPCRRYQNVQGPDQPVDDCSSSCRRMAQISKSKSGIIRPMDCGSSMSEPEGKN